MTTLEWETYTDGAVVGEKAEHDIFEFDISVDPSVEGAKVVWLVFVPTYTYDEGPGSDQAAEGQAEDFDAAKAACIEWLDRELAEQARIEAEMDESMKAQELEERRIEERDAIDAMEFGA
jgi:hypothetical protein